MAADNSKLPDQPQHQNQWRDTVLPDRSGSWMFSAPVNLPANSTSPWHPWIQMFLVAQSDLVCVVRMNCERPTVHTALSGPTSPSRHSSPASGGFGQAEVRKVKSGAGRIPSLPCMLCNNLLVGSEQEQLDEESRAVPPGPSGLVAWAGG